MVTAYKTNEQRAAGIVFDLINEQQPKFDLPKFISELRSLLIAEHQAAVRHPKDFTPEEWDFLARYLDRCAGEALMADLVQFEINEPVEVAFKFPEPRHDRNEVRRRTGHVHTGR